MGGPGAVDKEIAKLQVRKESRFRRVQRLYDLSENLDDPRSARDFETLLYNLDKTVEEYQDIIERLNDLNLQKNDEYKIDYSCLDAFEDLVCFIRRAAAKLKMPSTANKESSDSVPLAQLPKIELPEFWGDPIKWPVFYDTFDGLINKNDKLDNIAKVYYLMGCLKGRALESCSGIPPTAANYPILWELLVKKYQNPRLLADSYFQRMMEFRAIQSESSEALELFAERFSMAYNSLQTLNLSDVGNFLAASLALSKLDPASRKHFEMAQGSRIPTLQEVTEFARRQANALRQLRGGTRAKSVTPPAKLKSPQVLLTSCSSQEKKKEQCKSRSCPVCRQSHLIYSCPRFNKFLTERRWTFVKKNKLCINCLSDIHSITTCKSTNCCKYCGEKHHSLLHEDSTHKQSTEQPVSSQKTPASQVHNLCAFNGRLSSSRSIVLLPTAVILISTDLGKFPARFIVDSASQAHLITLNCCRRLQLQYQRGSGSIGGIGGISEQARGRVNFKFSSRLNEVACFEIEALVLDHITSKMPAVHVCKEDCEIFARLPLADPSFDCPGEVDGVIGASLFARLIQPSAPTHSTSSGASALPTHLGYIILGAASALKSSPKQTDEVTSLCVFKEPSIESVMQKFWELEEIESSEAVAVPNECEEIFVKTTTRSENGRYCVQLPFSEFPPNLGDSLSVARSRFYNLEKQFNRSPELKRKYIEGIQDYLAQEHISEIPLDPVSQDSYFMPHFAVVKASSSTPVRIVFDASCKTTNGRSLNDALLTGPKLQTDIQKILLRFRLHPVAVVADIRQMYRNILVHPSHRKYQRFLWRSDPEEPLKGYEMNVVPFGLSSAPFLALRTVRQLAQDERHLFPLASRIALHDMYVDDVVTSVSADDATELYSQLVGLFRAGGFSLAKWATNSPALSSSIPDQDQVTNIKSLEDNSGIASGVKVLGLHWSSCPDTFFFSVSPSSKPGSKRQILSILARIWDPLGFLSPVTLTCKVLIKKLWQSKCGWDDRPPAFIAKTWARFSEELPSLSAIKVPRYPGSTQNQSSLLVGFADSSEAGYGAVVYVITTDLSHQVKSTLLIAKSKVTPMKPCTIPRLELCAALLLAKLFQLVISIFPHISMSQIFALSDSEDVLHWLSKDPFHWKTFIANRVGKILEIVPYDRWFHVPSEQNAADCISRGLTPLRLASHPTWISGPSWLSNKIDVWPIKRIVESKKADIERKPLVATVTTKADLSPIQELISRSSSWRKLCNVVVYLLRFAKRLPLRRYISSVDLEKAEICLISFTQREHFATELAELYKDKPCSGPLRFLKPFLEEGCIRVGGRLAQAEIAYHKKHPVLLPKKCHVVNLLIDHYHRFYLHAGPNLLLSLLRQKYWILSARQLIRSRIHACNRCFRANPVNLAPLMADLPRDRVTAAKPFYACGVDYAGPFRVTLGRYRGVKSQKAYLCIFVCMAVKAIHLELASDLSTEAFLMCFSRFLSRRGPVKVMYSDCGTNFVGAKARLDALNDFLRNKEFQNRLNKTLNDHHIEWHFNPPSSPHFGGLWESNVKSVKTHLARVIGEQILSFEEFQTLIAQIECLLNSRPLVNLSEDPTEPEALTPAHFLNVTPLRSLPTIPPDLEGITLKTRKNLLDSLIKAYWRRWHLEYLSSLLPRKKWTQPRNSLTVGTVVVVRQENSPPLRWPLGVIEEVHAGADGVVRVATVRMGGALLKRPVVKLFPLPNQ